MCLPRPYGRCKKFKFFTLRNDMASITERIDGKGNKTYQVKIRMRGFPVQTATFIRKTDAKRWEQKTETAMREGKFFPEEKAKQTTLNDIINKYIAETLPLKPNSIKDYTQQLGHWKSAIGHMPLSEVNSAIISQERQKLLKGKTNRGIRTPATVNRYMSTLSHVFTIAIKEWELISINPCSNISKFKEGRGRTRFLSDGERNQLLKACIRLSVEEKQFLINNAIKHGGYIKPNGEVNLSQYIRDRVMECEVHIIKVDGMELVEKHEYQLQKLGRNFNQLLHQINIERHQYKINGQISEAIINKYNLLHAQYSDLKLSIKKSIDTILDLKKIVERVL